LHALAGGARVVNVNSGDTLMRTFILTAALVLAFGSAAIAAPCKDPKTGKLIKCPPAAAAPAATPAATAAPAPATGKAPHCVKGKVCGNSCIAVSKVCHKPA
jgi:hypothetical protein